MLSFFSARKSHFFTLAYDCYAYRLPKTLFYELTLECVCAFVCTGSIVVSSAQQQHMEEERERERGTHEQNRREKLKNFFSATLTVFNSARRDDNKKQITFGLLSPQNDVMRIGLDDVQKDVACHCFA
jgi:hypothetical protein